MRIIFSILLFAFPFLSHADINWSFEGAATDISAWSANTMNNTDSGVIGSFGTSDAYGSRIAKLVTDYEAESSFSEHYFSNGLISSRADGAYLSYNMNAGELSGLMNSIITIDIYSGGPAGISYTPPAQYIFLEGNLNGERLLLACAYPVSANGSTQTSTFSLNSSMFRPVTEFYCTVTPVRVGPFTYNEYTPNISLSDVGLDEAEFEQFLESVTAVRFWAAHDSSISALGLVPSVYTYVQSFSIVPVPEPGPVMLGALGMLLWWNGRRRRQGVDCRRD